LLPPSPSHPDFEFAGKMTPADEVGGDFYDVLQSGRDDALWITIGDVSSHGLSAGLVMLMAQASFATHFHSDPGASPDKVLRGVNSLLRENIAARLKQNKYLTAQLLAYRGDGRFTCAGAHQWPVILRARTKRCEIVETPGPWLGILPELDDVPLIEIALEPGDVLCLYSDGLTEAVNDDGDLFDTSRLTEALESAIEDSDDLDAAAARIFERVQAYSGRHDDDWTLLLVRRREDAESRRSAA
jgi:serine phosphatase RsbU (regulator of sigma subunit)